MIKVVGLGLLLVSFSAVGSPPRVSRQDNAASPAKAKVSTLRVSVTRNDTATPISGAEVTAQWGDGSESDLKTLTTGTKGVAEFKAIPRGKVQIVVVAPTFCTFKHSYAINNAEESIGVELRKDEGNCQGPGLANVSLSEDQGDPPLRTLR